MKNLYAALYLIVKDWIALPEIKDKARISHLFNIYIELKIIRRNTSIKIRKGRSKIVSISDT